MKKVISIREAQIINALKNKSLDEIMMMMTDDRFRLEMQSILPDAEQEMIMIGSEISNATSSAIRDVMVERHGEITDENPPTQERREDYLSMCSFVASEVLSRALAMYEPEDQNEQLKEFICAVKMTVISKRCELDALYAEEDAAEDDNE